MSLDQAIILAREVEIEQEWVGNSLSLGNSSTASPTLLKSTSPMMMKAVRINDSSSADGIKTS